MKKLILPTLISALCFTPVVNADWKDSLNSGLDKAKAFVSTSDEQDKPKAIEATPAQQVVVDNWDSIEKRFGKVIALKGKQDDAPVKSGIIKKGKSDYQEEIEELLEQVFNLISDEDLSDFQEQLTKNAKVKKEKIQELTTLKRKFKLSFDADDKADLQEDILELEADIAYVEQQKFEIVIAVKERLNDFGTYVTDEQVEALLIKVNAGDILSMTTVFPIIGEFANYLGQVTQDTGEDLASAKKYYGMYVLLLELQLFIQDQYITKLEHEFIPNLNLLRRSNVSLIEETKKLLRKSSGNSKEVYKNNLSNQRFTLKAVDLYKKQLLSDLNKIKTAKSRLKKDYNVAVNTYKTVDLSFNVSNLINSNAQLFDEVMNLQAPDLISFENEKMKEEFAKLTAHMKTQD
ncbi:hypothetical protein [Moritella marina]|uniref:hypothetical protein n=1 Tax=Moritella marina TaxID=90736 RepID=UPI003704AD9B